MCKKMYENFISNSRSKIPFLVHILDATYFKSPLTLAETFEFQIQTGIINDEAVQSEQILKFFFFHFIQLIREQAATLMKVCARFCVCVYLSFCVYFIQ